MTVPRVGGSAAISGRTIGGPPTRPEIHNYKVQTFSSLMLGHQWLPLIQPLSHTSSFPLSCYAGDIEVRVGFGSLLLSAPACNLGQLVDVDDVFFVEILCFAVWAAREATVTAGTGSRRPRAIAHGLPRTSWD